MTRDDSIVKYSHNNAVFEEQDKIKYIRENIIKYIEMNYNSSIIMYGPISSGKTTLMNELIQLLVEELLKTFEE